MPFWNKIRGELVDIIEWTDETSDTMVHRFPRYQNEIKYGAMLVVRESQLAAFINQGRLADVFAPGIHELETDNMPILSTMRGWKYGFSSPFKAEVYFVSTRRFTDLKWGTKNPIMARDSEFGFVRLRAFGTYSMRVRDAGAFIREIVGTDGRFTTDEITDQLRNTIVSRFSDVLGESNIAAVDMAANYDEIAEFLTNRVQTEFETYGLELTKLLVENISLPPEVEQAMDKRTSMGVVGNLGAFSQYQAASAMEDAANNPGTAGGAMGMGMGMIMANQIGQNAAPQQSGGGQVQGPPPIPQATQYFVAKDGRQTGPFDLDVLAGQAQRQQLTRETLVWRNGMSAWTAAGEVAELAHLFNQAPPPIPPG